MLWETLSGERSIDVEYRDRLVDVVEFDLALELARFTDTTAPWPDYIAQVDILRHLPSLDEFFQHDVDCEFSAESGGSN